ncbi:hypothetical protein ACFWBV_35415, partial [Streptomyces sp. NPDC060030]|uniref:hypothetical protein n=1 Tax=Streptomyces sp. NPDC060030 TaxID=3347042 RepID=UPI00369E5CF5
MTAREPAPLPDDPWLLAWAESRNWDIGFASVRFTEASGLVARALDYSPVIGQDPSQAEYRERVRRVVGAVATARAEAATTRTGKEVEHPPTPEFDTTLVHHLAAIRTALHEYNLAIDQARQEPGKDHTTWISDMESVLEDAFHQASTHIPDLDPTDIHELLRHQTTHTHPTRQPGSLPAGTPHRTQPTPEPAATTSTTETTTHNVTHTDGRLHPARIDELLPVLGRKYAETQKNNRIGNPLQSLSLTLQLPAGQREEIKFGVALYKRRKEYTEISGYALLGLVRLGWDLPEGSKISRRANGLMEEFKDDYRTPLEIAAAGELKTHLLHSSDRTLLTLAKQYQDSRKGPPAPIGHPRARSESALEVKLYKVFNTMAYAADDNRQLRYCSDHVLYELFFNLGWDIPNIGKWAALRERAEELGTRVAGHASGSAAGTAGAGPSGTTADQDVAPTAGETSDSTLRIVSTTTQHKKPETRTSPLQMDKLLGDLAQRWARKNGKFEQVTTSTPMTLEVEGVDREFHFGTLLNSREKGIAAVSGFTLLRLARYGWEPQQAEMFRRMRLLEVKYAGDFRTPLEMAADDDLPRDLLHEKDESLLRKVHEHLTAQKSTSIGKIKSNDALYKRLEHIANGSMPASDFMLYELFVNYGWEIPRGGSWAALNERVKGMVEAVRVSRAAGRSARVARVGVGGAVFYPGEVRAAEDAGVRVVRVGGDGGLLGAVAMVAQGVVEGDGGVPASGKGLREFVAA